MKCTLSREHRCGRSTIPPSGEIKREGKSSWWYRKAIMPASSHVELVLGNQKCIDITLHALFFCALILTRWYVMLVNKIGAERPGPAALQHAACFNVASSENVGRPYYFPQAMPRLLAEMPRRPEIDGRRTAPSSVEKKIFLGWSPPRAGAACQRRLKGVDPSMGV